MSRTGLTVVTALALAALSAGLMFGRWYVLGKEIDGTPGSGTWKVTLEIEGELLAKEASVTTVLPPDFRHQHVIEETFVSRELSHGIRTAKDGGERKAVWTPRIGVNRAQPFRLTYSFRCVTGMHRPTPGMVQRSRILDAAPSHVPRRRRARDERLRVLRPAPLVESEHPEVSDLAESLVPAGKDTRAHVRALYDYVSGLDSGPAVGALDSLRQKAGSDAGKARLLVALCRNQKVPARTVSGLILADGTPALHHWAEAWVENYWLPMDPSDHHFGAARFPDNYLVWQLGDEPIRGKDARLRTTRFTVADLHDSLDPQGAPPPSAARRIWRKMSLGNLRPEEQVWVKFLLLLPVAALIVSIFRTIIGISTFGTFGPALLGLVCRDVSDFPWALSIFIGIMLTGWLIRKLLDRYHLLMVPRISVLLTCIVILLVIALMLLGPEAGATHGFVALLPLIILTHMIERFWTVETEDGTAASFRTLLGTVIVAVAVTLIVNFDLLVNGVAHLLGHAAIVPPDVVRMTLFRYPEALGLFLAAQLLIGRYTGYRLTELFRFRDLLLEEFPSGGAHEPAGAHTAPEGNGRAGDEPAQHGVHSGSESADAVPRGGRQEADA
jgi:transglutaminase-like putative cysteine protease